MKEKKQIPKEVRLLREFRKDSGWSYVKLSQGIGVNPMTVFHWVHGTRAPSMMARRLIRAFLIEFEPKQEE